MDRFEAPFFPVLIVAAAALFGCSGTPPDAPMGSGGNPSTGGSPSDTGGSPQNSGGTPSNAGGESQRPPQGGDATRAWLDMGVYLDWACEPEVHASRSPSPHGFNRICSNDVLAAAADGDGEWPAGAAGVKELYDSRTSTEPMGFSVYLKLEDQSDGGKNWYWYERFPSGLIAASAGAGVCTGCHGRAGNGEANTPTPGARDYVFTPVR